MSQSEFPMLTKLMAGYLNMDAVEMTGYKELKGMVKYYTTRVSKKSLCRLLEELDIFEKSANDLDSEFEMSFDFGFNVEYYAGNTARLFEVIREIVWKKIC